jgi:hypothetical protein
MKIVLRVNTIRDPQSGSDKIEYWGKGDRENYTDGHGLARTIKGLDREHGVCYFVRVAPVLWPVHGTLSCSCRPGKSSFFPGRIF